MSNLLVHTCAFPSDDGATLPEVIARKQNKGVSDNSGEDSALIAMIDQAYDNHEEIK